MSKRVGSWLNIYLGGLLILVSGCQPGADLKYNQGMTTSTAQKNAHPVNGTKAVAKPYTGNIELKLDTDLLKGYKGPHKVVPFLSFSTKSKAGFKTQDLEAGPQIWQSELLTRTTGKPDEFDLTFGAPVGTYFLRVHNGDEQTAHRISSATVSLNGAAVSVPDDYSQEVALVQKTVEVTTAGTQQVHVRLASKPGSFLRLEVLKTYDPFEPVFDPADPSSLGDLYPDVPGNKNVPVPETEVTYVSLNNKVPTLVTTGQIMVQPKEPVTSNLQAILSRYNARLADPEPVEGYYIIQVDMTTIDLGNLESNLRNINERMTDPEFIIQSASFANVESARTLALVAELANLGLIENMNFDAILSDAAIQPLDAQRSREANSAEQHSLNTYDKIPGLPLPLPYEFPLSAQKSWWLNEHSTRVTEAWKYSMGYNYGTQKPVRVAVIDRGFNGLAYYMQPGQELDGRIVMSEARRIKSSYDLNTGSISDLTVAQLQQDEVNAAWSAHGTRVISTLVSNINNAKGIAGVAPQAQVIPYQLLTDNWSALTLAMRQISYLVNINSPVAPQVVNISLWNGVANDYMHNWVKSITTGGVDWYLSMSKTVDLLAARGVICVVAAGNGGWDVVKNYPGGPAFPNMITVGAVEDSDFNNANPPHDLTRAIFPRVTSDLLSLPRSVTDFQVTQFMSYGSNWSVKDSINTGQDFIDIWAPGNQMISSSGHEDSDQVLAPFVLDWKGTSAATPVVAGTVALIKSIAPNLNVWQIKSLLRDTAYPVKNYVDANLRSVPVTATGQVCGDSSNINCGSPLVQEISLRIMNSEAAVASVSGGLIAQSFQGHIVWNGSVYTLEVTNLPSHPIYTLAWAGNSNVTLLKNMYVEDVTTNPPSMTQKIADIATPFVPLPIQDIATSSVSIPIQVDGRLVGNTLNFFRIRKIRTEDFVITGSPQPTPPPDKTWTLKAFNVNDRVNVFVNGNLVVNSLGYNQSMEVQLNPYLLPYPTNNHISFQVYNDSNSTPGTAWGFEVLADGEIMYRDIRGKAGVFPAKRGDPSLGLVYDQSLTFMKNRSSTTSGDFSMNVYNTSDRSVVKIADTTVFDTNVSGTGFSSVDLNSYLLPTNFNRFEFQTYNSSGNYTFGFEVYRGGDLLYRNRDGERENLDIYPAGAQFNSMNCCGQINNDPWNMFVP